MNQRQLNEYMSATLLDPCATREQVNDFCMEASRRNLLYVCVHPCYIPLAGRLLRTGEIKVCTVIGFPFGAETRTVKAYQTREACANGAHELAVLMNISALKSGDLSDVTADIGGAIASCAGRPVKVVIEAALLTDDEKRLACRLAIDAGANYIQTGTGFCGDIREHDLRLIAEATERRLGIEACGNNIRTMADAMALISAGATRIGTPHAFEILDQCSLENG